MTGLHREVIFETDICTQLLDNGWLHDPGDAAHYDRALALFPADLAAWVEQTQPQAWATLTKNHGAQAPQHLAQQVRTAINKRTTIDVLRHGMPMVGVRQDIKLAQFKPALESAVIDELYAQNRLRVIRQVRYSLHGEQSIDLVLFLNGIPVATAELKSDFTQSIADAVDQYRFDRHPKNEPLLHHLTGAIVHFAVSMTDVRMTTKLEGAQTRFLPFNRGADGGAGNPAVPDGIATEYLWRTIWQRDSWLEILGRYVVVVQTPKRAPSHLIFPRYHQLDATRALVQAVRRDGVGGRYLIQHSAGSGKTNSIAWTAHFFADLHDAAGEKYFNSVLVVSDRNVIDAQLREALEAFERQNGVVASISGLDGSKSGELSAALDGDKKIVVCTIQTFPFALQAVRELAATKGKRFAVIADEAHSSQTGAAAAKLRSVLSEPAPTDGDEGTEYGLDDLLAAEMAGMAQTQGLTYVAYTATPKAKTIELFGTRSSAGPGADAKPRPFHVYSMRQAIEEGFILDVLQNYLPYSLAFQLTHTRPQQDTREVETNAARKRLVGWVRLHEYNIARKVETVIEHYRANVQQLLGGEAKAMVVVGSRVEAVRWKKAIDAYILRMRYPLKTLVAFSGDVEDPESFAHAVSEKSPELNPQLHGGDIRAVFNEAENHILLVANKFQTGFDQPKLCAMYIDKRLAGIQAVQTLSRLNRAYPGKDTTYVVDFANQGDEVLAAFQTYYQTAVLTQGSDPQVVVDLLTKLDSTNDYTQAEVDAVVAASVRQEASQKALVAAIQPVAQRLVRRHREAKLVLDRAVAAGRDDAPARTELEALELMRRDMHSYVKLYTFMAQMIDFGNPEFHKRMVFFRLLLPLLQFERNHPQIDLSYVELTAYNLRPLKESQLIIQPEDGSLEPGGAAGSGALHEQERKHLAEIIRMVNELFKGELTDGDMLTYVNDVLKRKLLESERLREQARNNSQEQFAQSPDLQDALLDAILASLTAHTSMGNQALGDVNIQRGLLRILLGPVGLWQALRQSEGQG